METELSLFRTAADDLWRYRNKLAMPGLYLTAEGSEFSRKPFAQNLSARAGMEYKVLKGGHLFPQESPEETAKTISEWIKAN